jgi:hypothetical protein
MEDFSTFTTDGLLERKQRLIDLRPEGPSPEFDQWVEMNEETIRQIDLEIAERRDAAFTLRRRRVAIWLVYLVWMGVLALTKWIPFSVAFLIGVLTVTLGARFGVHHWIAKLFSRSSKR